MKYKQLFAVAAVVLPWTGCSATVDITLPFISVDQEKAVANRFVSHVASARVNVDGVEKPVSRFEWLIRNTQGQSLPFNAAGDRVEWVPTKADRYQVIVTMAYEEGDASGSVTETRDLEVGDGAPLFSAIEQADGILVTWPTSIAPLQRTFELTCLNPGGAPSAVAVANPDAGSQIVPFPPSLDGLRFSLAIKGSDGAAIYTTGTESLPASAKVELWAIDGTGTRLISPASCTDYRWRFPDVGTSGAAGASLEFRNTGRAAVAYQFREAWVQGQKYLPGVDGGPAGGANLFGVAAPGEIVDITPFYMGMFGVIGSYRPLSTGGMSKDEDLIPWPPGSLSWTQGGQAETRKTDELYVSMLTISPCETSNSNVWDW